MKLLLALLLVLSTQALAAWPEKPIRIIVPFAPGGGTDIMTRAIARKMSDVSGYTMIVENRPGAGGNVAAVAAAKSPPDGYTLLIASPGTHGINTHLYKNAGFDPMRDFAMVGMIGSSAMVMFVNAAVPAQNLAELIALVRKSPGKYPYGSPGSGTQHHLAVEQLKLKAKLDMPHVPYKGAGPAMTDLVAGHVPIAIAGFGPGAPYVAQGKIRVIAAANTSRLPSAKDVPVFAETVPGVGVGSWVGFVVPAGTPADVVRALGATLQKALADAELQKALAKIGVDVDYQTPEAFARLVAAEMPMWKEVIEASGAKAD